MFYEMPAPLQVGPFEQRVAHPTRAKRDVGDYRAHEQQGPERGAHIAAQVHAIHPHAEQPNGEE